MPALKSVIAILAALVPVGYCGGLVFYFLDFSGGVQNAQEIGLGPTVIGLAIVGLLFCIPLVWKINRSVGNARPPGRGHDPETPVRDETAGGEVDAMIARYMAQRSDEPAPSRSFTRSGQANDRPANRPAFGRRLS